MSNCKETAKTWIEVERPGYFGKKRLEIVSRLNEKYGKDGWKEMWVVDGKIVMRQVAVHLYADAYRIYLREHPDVLSKLIGEARDVYDNDPSNVESGLDYNKQETVAVHLQDIAVRNAVRDLGAKFEGEKLVQIRSTSENEIGKLLSPGSVPFHRPHIIRNPRINGWWKRDTIEDFYQSNKIIAAWKARED